MSDWLCWITIKALSTIVAISSCCCMSASYTNSAWYTTRELIKFHVEAALSRMPVAWTACNWKRKFLFSRWCLQKFLYSKWKIHLWLNNFLRRNFNAEGYRKEFQQIQTIAMDLIQSYKECFYVLFRIEMGRVEWQRAKMQTINLPFYKNLKTSSLS